MISGRREIFAHLKIAPFERHLGYFTKFTRISQTFLHIFRGFRYNFMPHAQTICNKERGGRFMQKENVNYKAITDVYKNAHIALQSISDILPAVEDEELKKELKEEYDGYEKLIGEISGYLAEKSIEPKDINVFKKAMMTASVKMKTLIDDSRNNIADMMIKGTVMGVNELTAMKNEEKNFDEKVAAFIDKLLALEEGYHERLKKFL